ncbi:Hypothetical predicted protein [Mytilus galloprovincialis]|uniref:TIR domain-containing protein n=1 Tax=Mytilus galloprovincialis TaxID=29158 RepID=A0A8B6DNM5_MYTGA|nr:Hypothetical predicted protein [Mytilus galloprovincialis]
MATVIEGDEQRSVERKELPDGKKFHVFISYSESDRLWVGTVIQHLQNDYNFKCVEHSSDFIPGMKITENIEYAMSNSAKTMFILTEEYRQQYNHELSLNRVRDAVNRNRNLDLLHEEKSHFSCRGPVFRWKYVPESLSIPPMQNHWASELHNKRIRENQNREMVSLNTNYDATDDDALLDNTTVDSVTCDVQKTVTNYLLDLSSAYLQNYMNEKLEHAGDNNRHATKAKCICQFAESLEFAEMQIV